MIRCRRVLCVVTVLWGLTILALPGRCEDWPAYRKDAARSGATPEGLRFALREAWVYVPPAPPRPAWPEAANNVWDISNRGGYSQSLEPQWSEAAFQTSRLDWDYAPQPVMAGGLVYFGSSTDDTVRAIEASTGKVRWQFTTGGPIRFAPAIAAGKAYVASDDGWLYCLDAASGDLVWRFHAASRDAQVLGNGRMISRWPLRSGVLVKDGIAYLTAGMWPAEGVYVYALDAATGRVLWCNDTSNAMWMDQPHRTAYALTGIAPQGYLLASAEVLLVPMGRAAPAGFDRKTGRLLYYRQARNKAQGGVWACIDESKGVFYNGGYRGRLGGYLLATGTGARGKSFRRLVIADGAEYGFARAVVVGPKWRATHPSRVYSLAAAGKAVLAGGVGSIAAYDGATGEELWQSEVEGEVRGIAVADGHIAAGTSTGMIYCFGPDTGAVREPLIVGAAAAGESADTSSVREVGALLEQSGITKGYALVVGAPDARFAEALATATDLHVISALVDRQKVDAERGRLVETGLYGTRIAVQHLAQPDRLPFSQYFANAVIVCGGTAGLSGEELYRVLRPCGGVMCFDSVPRADAEALVRAGGAPDGEVRRQADSVIVVRGKLPGAFDWDSQVVCDERVRWPLELLWYGGPGPARMSDRHWGTAMPVVANGRYFTLGEHDVIAVDAYNGTELWSRRIPYAYSRPFQLLKSLAADDDSVYLNFGSVCFQLDAQTGEQVKVFGDFAAPKQYSLARTQTFDIAVDGSHSGAITLRKGRAALEITLETTDPIVNRGDRWELFFDFRPPARRAALYGPGVFQEVVEIRAGTSHHGVGVVYPEFDVTAEQVSGGSRLLLEMPWDEVAKVAGRQPAAFAFAAVLVGDDGSSKVRRTGVFADVAAHIYNAGWPTFVLDAAAVETSGAPQAPVAPISELPQLAGRAGRLPYRPGAGRPQPGITRTHPITGGRQPKSYIRGYGCAGIASSATMDFFRSGTLGFYDFEDDSGIRNFGGVRPGCGQTGGLVAGLGLLISKESSSGCTCSYNFQTSLALAPVTTRRNEDWALFHAESTPGAAVENAALNFGAPGDRRDKGVLWQGFPRPWSPKGQGGLTLTVPLHVEGVSGLDVYRLNADRVTLGGTEKPWIYASGYRGIGRAVLDLSFYEPVLTHLSMRFGQGPEIDGELSDACWDGSARTCFPKRNTYFYCWEPDAPAYSAGAQAAVYVRHDDENLYIACERRAVTDSEGNNRPWRRAAEGEDASVWTDDSFEMYFTSDGVPRFAHLGLSASGARYDALWNGVFDIPRLEGITLDGEPGEWGEKGLHVNIYKGSCRIGWDDRGLLLLADFQERFVSADRRFFRMLFMAIKPGTFDSVQLDVDARRQTCLMADLVGDKAENLAEQPAGSSTDLAYTVEALFPWETLGIRPAKGDEIGFAIIFARDGQVRRGDVRSIAADVNRTAYLRLADEPGPSTGVNYAGGFGAIMKGGLMVEEDAGWNATWSGAVTITPDVFTAEVAVPWSVLEGLGLKRDSLRVDFQKTGRLARLIDEAKRSCIAPLVRGTPKAAAKPYTVRLHFAEPDDVRPGQRVFDVKLQGRTVLEDFDIVKAAGGRLKAVVKEFTGVRAANTLIVELIPKSEKVTAETAPLLAGLEVTAE